MYERAVSVDLQSLSEKCIKLSESSFASLKRVLCETNCILQRVLIEKCAFWVCLFRHTPFVVL